MSTLKRLQAEVNTLRAELQNEYARQIGYEREADRLTAENIALAERLVSTPVSAGKMGALSAEALKREMRQCIAWGVPDNECAGMVARNLVAVISKALARIEQLEKE